MWGYTPNAEARFEFLLQNKPHVGTKNLQIAAIALAGGATLLSRNGRDFSRIPA